MIQAFYHVSAQFIHALDYFGRYDKRTLKNEKTRKAKKQKVWVLLMLLYTADLSIIRP